MLSIKDLVAIQKMMTQMLDEKFRQFYEDHIKHIPTKDAFFTRMDALTKEIKDAREELAAHAISHDRLTEKDEELEVRVLTLEKKVSGHARNN